MVICVFTMVRWFNIRLGLVTTTILSNGTHRVYTTPLYQKKVTQSTRSFHEKRRCVDCRRFSAACRAHPLYSCHESNCISCPYTIRLYFFFPRNPVYLSSTKLQMEAVSSPRFGIYSTYHKTQSSTSLPRDCLLTRGSPPSCKYSNPSVVRISEWPGKFRNENIDMRRLTTGIRSEKCVVR